jgi:hypothetical protein
MVAQREIRIDYFFEGWSRINPYRVGINARVALLTHFDIVIVNAIFIKIEFTLHLGMTIITGNIMGINCLGY